MLYVNSSYAFEKQDILIQEFENSINKPKVSLEFKENLNWEDILQEIAKISDPSIIMWYMGTQGLKERAIAYYRDPIGKILDLKNNSRCFLYDLYAWRALNDKKTKLDDFNSSVEVINRFAIARLQCIKSSDFFSWLKNEDNLEVISYLKNTVLKREVIFEASKGHQSSSKMTVGKVFKGYTILEEESKRSVAKIYSALQYIEGIYLVNQLIEDRIKDRLDEINIVFVLPNDESKYYPKECFLEDIEASIKSEFGDQLNNKKVNIRFYNFSYVDKDYTGKPSSARPYNSGKEVITEVKEEQVLSGVVNREPIIQFRYPYYD